MLHRIHLNVESGTSLHGLPGPGGVSPTPAQRGGQWRGIGEGSPAAAPLVRRTPVSSELTAHSSAGRYRHQIRQDTQNITLRTLPQRHQPQLPPRRSIPPQTPAPSLANLVNGLAHLTFNRLTRPRRSLSNGDFPRFLTRNGRSAVSRQAFPCTISSNPDWS